MEPSIAGLALLLLIALAATSQGQAPLLPTGEGSRTLRDLDYGDVVLGPGAENRTLEIQLPRNASQGPGLWTRIHLKVAVRLNGSMVREAPRSLAYISGSLNGWAYASAKLDFPDPAMVRWDFVNVTGAFRETAPLPRLALDLSNYPPIPAVQPGAARLEFRLETLGAPVVEEARVLSTSRIETTPTAPPRLRISRIEGPPAGLRVDEEFNLRVVLHNLGDLPVKNTRVSLIDPGGLLAPPRDDETRRFDWIGTEAHAMWRPRALRPGGGTLQVLVRSESSDSSPTLEVPISIRPPDVPLPLYLGAALAATILLLALLRRRRRGPRGPPE